MKLKIIQNVIKNNTNMQKYTHGIYFLSIGTEKHHPSYRTDACDRYREYLVPTIYDSLFRSASGMIDNGHDPHARSRSRKQRGRQPHAIAMRTTQCQRSSAIIPRKSGEGSYQGSCRGHRVGGQLRFVTSNEFAY